MRSFVLATALAIAVTATAGPADDLDNLATQAMARKAYIEGAGYWIKAFQEDATLPWRLTQAAGAYAQAGETESAFGALNDAMTHGFVSASELEADSNLLPLHRDPRWSELLAQMRAKDVFDSKLFGSAALATPYEKNLSEDEKIAGLSKLWSEVKYNFVYIDTLKAIDWDRLYLAYLPRVRATASTYEYYRLLAELTAKLHDGHSSIWPPRELWDRWLALPPIRTSLIEGRVMVLDVFDPELRQKGLVPGVEIVEVNNEPVKTFVARENAPVVSAATPQDAEARLYGRYFLAGSRDEPLRLTVLDAAGRRETIPVQRIGFEEYMKRAQPAPFELRFLPGNVAYVVLNSFGDDTAAEQFIAAFGKIEGARALIIDVRNNGGGNSSVGYKVLATLTDKPFMTSKWATRDYRPTYRAWGRTMPDLEQVEEPFAPDLQHQFHGPVAVLTSATTYSAGEDFVVAFDALGRGKMIGQTTGGSTGQPLVVALPGGGTARICTKRDTYPDGRIWVGKGIRPNLLVSPTVDSLRHGRDLVLEEALAAVRK